MKFNKILLVIASFLALAISSLGQNNIGTLVTDPIRPFSVSSTHPSAIANEIKGGPFTSSNLAGLSNIPAPRLEIGAIGYATNTGLYYRLTATNPATWSPIDGGNITNLNASNITGSIPFLNISNALTNASVAFGTATFNNTVQGPIGVATNPAFRFGTNQSGFYYGSQLGFGQSVAVSIFGSNIARFQSNRVVFDQPIDFLSSTNPAALTTRTNLGIQDFVTNPVVQVVSGGTGATNAGGARTNLGLGVLDDVAFNQVIAYGGVYGDTNDVVLDTQNYLLYDVSGSPAAGWGDGSWSFYVPFNFVGTNAAINIATSRTNLGLGGANSVVFSNLLLSNGAQTNLAIAIGSTNRGIHASAGPDRISVVVAGVPSLQVYSNAVETATGISLNLGGNAVVGSNLNVLGSISVSGSGATRTNLGLGWPALTNSNAGTGLVSVNTNGEVVSPTNFWQVAPIQTLVQDFTVVVTTQTNNATNARNLYIYSLATNVSGISNIIILPTNAAAFAGDEVTVVHRGTTNTATVIRQAGSTNNLITLSKFDEAVKFIKDGNWDFYHNISYVEPIQFSGTNTAANAAASRTNLGLGATNEVQFKSVFINGVFNTLSNAVEIYQPLWIGDRDSTNAVFEFETSSDVAIARTNLGLPLAALTNTNNAKFQEAIFATNAAPTNPTTPNFGDHAAWMGVSIVTNGVTNVFKIPLYK